MKKCIIFTSLILFFSSFVFSLNVDENEVKTTDETIDFINYKGRHDEIDTIEAIRNIGSGLKDASKSGQSGSSDRYLLIHAVDASVKEGLDADILVLGRSVRVDHIDNLRLIIEGYLSSSYGYSRQDAKTLAHFITIYNAVYRGKIDSFNKKYKSVVLKYLNKEKVGLSTIFSEWAGNTQIVIPLTDQKYSGTISTVDTGVISDKNVVNKMKEQDDKDIDARKDMVNLKEKEAEEARKRAEETNKTALEKEKDAEKAKKEAEEADKKLKEKEKALKEKEKVATQAQREAEEAKKSGASDQVEKQKNAEKARKEAEDAEKERDKAQAEKDKKDEDAKEKQDEVDELKKQANEEENMAKEKEEDAQDDRKDIASDTQKIIEDKKAEKKAETDALIASAVRGYALKVVDEDTLSSSIVMLDLRNGKPIKTSSLDTIKGRHIYEVGEELLAIAGSSGGNGVVSLVLINMRTLEITKQGDDIIAEKSVLEREGEYYYAIVSSGGKYYVGKFNAKLEKQSLSDVSVAPYSPITVTDQGILAQNEAGEIYLLDKTSLKNLSGTERKSYTSFTNEH